MIHFANDAAAFQLLAVVSTIAINSQISFYNFDPKLFLLLAKSKLDRKLNFFNATNSSKRIYDLES